MSIKYQTVTKMELKMTIKIDKKITGCSVLNIEDRKKQFQEEQKATEMNEKILRPKSLIGKTYKIEKSPANEHALYVTINDIVLDEGTKFERRKPFEIFVNSKNMDQFQWIVALTRIMSAVFRKGGDVTFLAEEMKSVFDPHGGYFRPGGYMPSLIAEIGEIVQTHFEDIGLMDKKKLDDAQIELINKKKEEFSAGESQFPPSAAMCNKCHQKAVVIMDGCATCLNCGNSKCG